MIPIDVRIESQIHRSFVDFHREQNIDQLIHQFKKYDHEEFHFKLIDSIKGEVDNLIHLAESPNPVDPDHEGFLFFIKTEKLAALRLLKFNKAAELADIENNMDLQNQKTTASPLSLTPVTLIMYYCVLLKGKDVYILIDTNYFQYHWSLKTFIKSLRTKREND